MSTAASLRFGRNSRRNTVDRSTGTRTRSSHDGDRRRDSAEPAARRAWIFQSSPDQYDLAGALESLAEFYWLVRRYEKEIHVGDRVYLWEAGSDAGVAAIAEVASEPADVEDSHADKGFWRDPAAFLGPRRRVLLKITKVVDPRLSRAEAQANPALAKLPNLVFAQGTNFPLTPVQDQELQRVIAGLAPLPTALTFEALQQETGWDAERLRELADAIIRGRRQVVLAGPPGTGKTWVAGLVARYVTGDQPGRTRLVQFHPSYTYEQFIEGLRPGRGQRRDPVRPRRRDRPRCREDDGATPDDIDRHRHRRDEPREPVQGVRRAHVPLRVPRRRRSTCSIPRASRCRRASGSSAR